MATWYCKNAGSIFAANNFAATSGGAGTNALGDGTILTADTIDLNGQAATTANGSTITQALVQATTGTITLTGTLVINGAVTYNGTSTSGMIIVGSGATLTVNSGTVTNTAAGYAVIESSSGIVAINNSGGTAVSCSGSGRGVSMGGTGAATIAGNVAATAGQAVYFNSSSNSHALSGNLTATGSSYAVNVAAGTLLWSPQSGVSSAVSVAGNLIAWGMYVNGGIVNVSSASALNTTEITDAGSSLRPCSAIAVISGTFNYFGSQSLASSAECTLTLFSGTLNLVKQTSSYDILNLANSGSFVIRILGGTLNLTGNGGAAVAQIVNQNATSYAAILGTITTGTRAASIVGPTIPAAGLVETGTARGYPGDANGSRISCAADHALHTGTGYYGNPSAYTDGTYYQPNLDSNAGVSTTAAVLNTAHYGAANAVAGTGAGGYTYGSNTAGDVLDTATAPGTYHAITTADARHKGSNYFGVSSGSDGLAYIPGASDVRKTVNVDATTGSLVGIVDSTGAQHNYGTCSSTQAYAAAGIVHDSGTAASSGTLTSAGAFNATGILSAAATYNATGILAAAGYAATGIYDGSTKYTSGVWNGTSRIATGLLVDATTSYATGWWNGSSYVASPDFPAVSSTLSTATTNGSAGTFVAPTAAQLIQGQSCGVAGAIAGTQYVAGASDVRFGVNTGITTGTLVGIVDSAGVYHATGVIYAAGSYATEASRNSATAGQRRFSLLTRSRLPESRRMGRPRQRATRQTKS